MSKANNIEQFSLSELAKFKKVKIKEIDIDMSGKPIRIPTDLPSNHTLVARVDYGDMADPEFISCKSLEEMQQLYNNHRLKSGLTLDWYSTKD